MDEEDSRVCRRSIASQGLESKLFISIKKERNHFLGLLQQCTFLSLLQSSLLIFLLHIPLRELLLKLAHIIEASSSSSSSFHKWSDRKFRNATIAFFVSLFFELADACAHAGDPIEVPCWSALFDLLSP